MTKSVKKVLDLDMVASLLDDSQCDENLSHNLAMFIYLMTNDEVLLVSSCDMSNLLAKMYWFTPIANRNISEPEDYVWPDSAIVFTRRQ